MRSVWPAPGARQKCGEGFAGRGCGVLDAWDVVGLRSTASFWNVPKKYGQYGDLFFFMKKEPTIHEKVVVSERDTEDGSNFSDEEGEHNVENSMLCSFAHACSPLLQKYLHEEELCEALTCHFSFDVLYFCQE